MGGPRWRHAALAHPLQPVDAPAAVVRALDTHAARWPLTGGHSRVARGAAVAPHPPKRRWPAAAAAAASAWRRSVLSVLLVPPAPTAVHRWPHHDARRFARQANALGRPAAPQAPQSAATTPPPEGHLEEGPAPQHRTTAGGDRGGLSQGRYVAAVADTWCGINSSNSAWRIGSGDAGFSGWQWAAAEHMPWRCALCRRWAAAEHMPWR
jgi:hypothetical protein